MRPPEATALRSGAIVSKASQGPHRRKLLSWKAGLNGKGEVCLIDREANISWSLEKDIPTGPNPSGTRMSATSDTAVMATQSSPL